MDDLCKFLEWDSAHFGFRIASALVNRLTLEKLEDIRRWCKSERIDCLYFLADGDDGTARLLQGVPCVDVRVTLDRSLQGIIPSGSFHTARAEDIPALQRIAQYEDSRFYHDPHFSTILADCMFDLWVERSVARHTVLMAEGNGLPIGYVACDLVNGVGHIELLGVAPDRRGSGLGVSLVKDALRWLGQAGRSRVSVVTQGRNIAAQRVYQSAGFKTRSVQFWYHIWF